MASVPRYATNAAGEERSLPACPEGPADARFALVFGRLADAVMAAAADTGDATAKVGLELPGGGLEYVEVPGWFLTVLGDLLEDLSNGRDVTSAPRELLVGTQAAAAILGVSRVWVTNLVDRGDLPAEKRGTKRRIRLGDLLDYRREDTRRRAAAVDWSFLDDDAEAPDAVTR